MLLLTGTRDWRKGLEGELMTASASGNHRRFLLTEGGPSHRLEIRMGLIRANSPSIVRRSFLSILATWLPLLVLSALQRNAIGHLTSVSFLWDFAVHARFLLTVPVLLWAATVLGPHLADAAGHFVESGLVVDEDFKAFDDAIERGLRWRDSSAAEAVLLVLAYTITLANLISLAVHVSTWYATRTASGIELTWAGWWFVLFCVPWMQFLMLRWLWRLFLWGQFLWRMNRLRLRLIPTHPDQAGGLAFVGEAQRYFGIILLAFSIGAAGVLANSIVYDKLSLLHFAPVITTYVFVAVGVFLIPILVFSGTLFRTKRSGLYQYGTLSTEYTSSFHQKWIIAPRQTTEVLLGTSDIQSLADLGNSYSFVDRMDVVPMGYRTPIYLALACLVPMAPLVLTMMPIDEIFKMLLKAFL
jgi:hypothetical protein